MKTSVQGPWHQGPVEVWYVFCGEEDLARFRIEHHPLFGAAVIEDGKEIATYPTTDDAIRYARREGRRGA